MKLPMRQAEYILQEEMEEFYAWLNGRGSDPPGSRRSKQDAVTDLNLRIPQDHPQAAHGRGGSGKTAEEYRHRRRKKWVGENDVRDSGTRWSGILSWNAWPDWRSCMNRKHKYFPLFVSLEEKEILVVGGGDHCLQEDPRPASPSEGRPDGDRPGGFLIL